MDKYFCQGPVSLARVEELCVEAEEGHSVPGEGSLRMLKGHCSRADESLGELLSIGGPEVCGRREALSIKLR